jgi:hypothetical protein
MPLCLMNRIMQLHNIHSNILWFRKQFQHPLVLTNLLALAHLLVQVQHMARHVVLAMAMVDIQVQF